MIETEFSTEFPLIVRKLVQLVNFLGKCEKTKRFLADSKTILKIFVTDFSICTDEPLFSKADLIVSGDKQSIEPLPINFVGKQGIY